MRWRDGWLALSSFDRKHRECAMKVPKIIYVTVEGEGEEQYLMPNADLSEAEDGKVYVFTLEDEIDKRSVSEIKRKGTSKWFKPE